VHGRPVLPRCYTLGTATSLSRLPPAGSHRNRRPGRIDMHMWSYDILCDAPATPAARRAHRLLGVAQRGRDRPTGSVAGDYLLNVIGGWCVGRPEMGHNIMLEPGWVDVAERIHTWLCARGLWRRRT
jgi:hypothetical protein